MGKDIVKDGYKKFCLHISGATIVFVFLIVTFLLNTHLFTQKSLVANTINLSFIAAFLAAIFGVYQQSRTERVSYGKLWPAFAIALGVSYGFIGSILGRLFSSLIEGNIKTISAAISLNLLIALFCGILVYCASSGVFRLNKRKYIILTLATFFIGFFASIALTQNQYWWKSSICTLGMPSSKHYEIYNLTLITFGLSLVVFASYLRPLMRSLLSSGVLNAKKVKILSFLYFIGLVDFAMVGAVPYGIYSWMNPVHVFLGSFVFYDISLIMFLSFWLFNKFSRKFVIANYILLLVCVLSYSVGFYTKIIPFSYSEIAMTLAALTWVGLLIMELSNIKKSSLSYGKPKLQD